MSLIEQLESYRDPDGEYQVSDDTDFRISSIAFVPLPHIVIRPSDDLYVDNEKFIVSGNNGFWLSKTGEWERDPGRGGRSLAFLSRCRFDTLDDAKNAIRRFYRDVYSVGRVTSE